MRAINATALMCLILLIASVPHDINDTNELEQARQISNSNSDISISYSNGPTNGQSLTGVYTLSFALSGSNTVDSLSVEISSDATNWAGIATLTSSPWVTYLDTTTFANGSYQLKAIAYDSTADENVIETSPSFTIANQVPVITEFTVNSIEYGSGSSASDRAWFSIAADATLELSLIHI